MMLLSNVSRCVCCKTPGYVLKSRANWITAVGFPTHYCDPNYECSFTYVDNGGRTWEFDLSGLCRGNDYVATDAQNHTYNFNICGLSHFKCLPTWRDTYQYGVAVQVCD